MTQSTCPKCDSHNFELKELKVRGANFKLSSVQCSSCGCIVGIQEYMNIGAMLHKQNQAIRQIAAKIGVAVILD